LIPDFPKVFGRLAIPYQSFKELYKFNPMADLFQFCFPERGCKGTTNFLKVKRNLKYFLNCFRFL